MVLFAYGYSLVLDEALLQSAINRSEHPPPPKKTPPKYCVVQSHQLIVILVLFILLSINEYSIPRIVVFSIRLYQGTLNQANRGYNTLHWHKIVRCAKAGQANCPPVKTTIKTQRELRTQQI